MLRTFVQIESIVLTLLSAIFLAKGNLGLSPEQIAGLSSTKYDYNPTLLTAFAEQHAETWIGVIFLLLAFAFQLAHEFWPSKHENTRISRRTGVLVTVVFSAATLLTGWMWARARAHQTEQRVKEILERKP